VTGGGNIKTNAGSERIIAKNPGHSLQERLDSRFHKYESPEDNAFSMACGPITGMPSSLISGNLKFSPALTWP
jgi:hypothetical protein